MSDGKGESTEARIAKRLRPSGDGTHPAHSVQHGTGPTRTITSVHPKDSGNGAPGPISNNQMKE
jgi:hypothetical protein